MGSPFAWLRNFVDRLLRLNLFLPLVAVSAVVVVILAPVLWSFYEASFYFGSRDAAPAAHVYEVNRGTEKYLEQAFALDNGIQGFSPTERDLMLKFTIDKVADLDLARRTVFVSGKVSAVWSPESLGQQIITSDRYQAARIAGYEEQDLLKDLEMPDLVKDDFYTYDPLVLRQIQKGDKSVFVSEYNFSGNIRFPLNLREYPLDVQRIPLQVRHKILPSYMLKFQSLKPELAFERPDFFVGQYRIDKAQALPPSIEALYDSSLKKVLLTPTASPQQAVQQFKRAEAELRANSKQEGGFKQRLGALQSRYFGGPVGPRSVAGITLDLRRQFSTTLMRSMFPVSLALLLLVLSSYIPYRFTDVKLAVPPTILVSLVFMQQGAYSGLPDLGYPILLDYFYLMAYVVTLLMFMDLLLSSLKRSSSWTWLVTYNRFVRVLTLAVATVGPVVIWFGFRILNSAMASAV